MFYLRLMDLLIVWHLRHFSMQMMSTVPCQPISGRMAFVVAIGEPNPPQWPNDLPTLQLGAKESLPAAQVCIGHINIRSLRNKVHEVADLLSVNHLAVLAISETRLDSSDSDDHLAIGVTVFPAESG